jgi:TonB family protein
MSTPVRKEYIPTIIDSRSLLPRLASELTSLQRDCKKAWPDFKRDPFLFIAQFARSGVRTITHGVLAPNVIAALIGVTLVIAIVVFADRKFTPKGETKETDNEVASEMTMLNLTVIKKTDNSIGRNGTGRLVFAQGNGEGSGESRRRAQGGGGSGEKNPLPPQAGKLPPPSTILAAIPKTPPVYPPSLPVAGIDIDPALWKDEKAPVFGDPRLQWETNSKGPGTGGGIGTNRGLGLGEGEGPGVGPGKNGNMGGGDAKQIGCCGGGGAVGGGSGLEQILPPREVEQRARLLLKPEPQYTEEARRNQITGTVMLRVVFSSLGQVEQIRALQTLPFGLTEKAIAAARQIKFVPATKGGRPVSVWMQLEYNFNLY